MSARPAGYCPRRNLFWTRVVFYLHYLLFDRKALKDICNVGVADRRVYDRTRIPSQLILLSGMDGVRQSLLRLKQLGAENNFRVLVFGPMGTKIVDLCKALDIPYSNTNEDIPEGAYPKEFYVHFMHPRQEGHRVLAEHLEKTLEARHWLTCRGAK